jgi:hypothetical protein
MLDLMYRQFLAEVALVQAEQLAALRCLDKHHGLADVWAEGLSKEGLADYLEAQALLQKAEAEGAQGEEYPLAVLRYGAPGQLFWDGLIQAVLPTEDEALLGKFTASPSPQIIQERDQFIAKQLTAHSTFSLIVLGGGHA